MRILHTSDWHLGQHFYGKSRAYEHQQFLAWLIEQVKLHQVDAIVVAGDIFDTGNPPSYARELYFDFITQLQQYGTTHNTVCQLVILAGNHDSTAMVGESKQLLSNFNTFVVPSTGIDIKQQVFTLNNKNDEPAAVMCAVPFIRARDVLASKAGQSANDKQHQLQEAIAQHYQRLYQQALLLSDEKLPIIATGHMTTVGATTSDSVRDIYIGTLDAFPASAFPPVDYLALGHIHQMQTVAKSAHIRYCGSPIPLSFDEAKQDKYVLLVDVHKGQSPDIEPLTIPTFQPIAMIKTQLDTAKVDIEKLLATKVCEQPIWLDIEIESQTYRHDLHIQITEQLKPYIEQEKIEILLLRRSKTSRQQALSEKTQVMLEELTPMEVFEARLAQEGLSIEKPNNKNDEIEQPLTEPLNEQIQNRQIENEQKEKHAKLTLLFEQAIEEVKAKQNEQNSATLEQTKRKDSQHEGA